MYMYYQNIWFDYCQSSIYFFLCSEKHCLGWRKGLYISEFLSSVQIDNLSVVLCVFENVIDQRQGLLDLILLEADSFFFLLLHLSLVALQIIVNHWLN